MASMLLHDRNCSIIMMMMTMMMTIIIFNSGSKDPGSKKQSKKPISAVATCPGRPRQPTSSH